MSDALKAGSVKIQEFKLHKAGQEFDILPFLVELSIFEDLFSNAISGTVIISDGNNLIGSLPIVGGEILNISITVPSFRNNRIHRAFYVYAIKDRAPSSTDRQQTYMLCFTTLEAAIDNVTYISKKFSGYPDDIAEEIYNDYLAMPQYWSKYLPMPMGLSRKHSLTQPNNDKIQSFVSGAGASSGMTRLQVARDFFGSPKNKVTFLATMWTPFKTLNWLANRHIEGTNTAPNTFCWQTTQASYFTSIDTIFKGQKDVTSRKAYYYGLDDAAINTIVANKSNGVKNAIPLEYSKVETVIIPTGTDILQSQEHGHYASNMHVFDVVTKKYDEYIFDYASNFDSIEHLHGKKGNPQPTFPSQQLRNIYSYRTFRPKHKNLFNDYEDPKYEDWVLQRTSMLYDLSNLKVEITVPGFCNTEAGEVIEFYYPKMGDKPAGSTYEQLIDPYLSGSYLVTAIRHIITQEKYYMRLELVKESLATALG